MPSLEDVVNRLTLVSGQGKHACLEGSGAIYAGNAQILMDRAGVPAALTV